jgi:hypothetical protein
VPIHTLSFGVGADYDLMRKFSMASNGLARKVRISFYKRGFKFYFAQIYEDADAALQIDGFYAEISSPLLTNVQFTYFNASIEPGSFNC